MSEESIRSIIGEYGAFNHMGVQEGNTVVAGIVAAIDTCVKEAQVAMLERIMESRKVHSPVTNGHIHVKNVDYEYWKLTGESLL